MGNRGLSRERIARQGLTTRSCATTAAAAAHTGAVQAQDPAASRLGIRVRAKAVSEADVTAAVADDRSVTRTWLLRGTIHLVDTADLRWLLRLLRPSLFGRCRARWDRMGLTQPVLERTAAMLSDVLAGEPLTRHEIMAAMAERGLTLDTDDPQAPTHLLIHASISGLVCRAHDRGRDATFTLLDDWIAGSPEGPSDDDALAELARRYFTAFSPATAADFTTWSGLGGRRAIELIHDELSPADVDGRPGYRLGEVEPARGVTLLPAFDNYLLGYRDRAAILHESRRERVYEGGMIRAAVLDDGRVVGTWTLARAREPAVVTVTPFEPLTKRAGRAVEAEVADIGRFLGRPTVFELRPPVG